MSLLFINTSFPHQTPCTLNTSHWGLVDSSANIVQNGARHDDPLQNGVALGLDQKVSSSSVFVLANNSTNVTSYYVISHANERPYIGSVVHNLMLIFILIASTGGATYLPTLLNFAILNMHKILDEIIVV